MNKENTTIYMLDGNQPQLGENTWIAPSATVIGRVSTGRNVSIWYNVVIRGDNDPITIGDNSNIQDGTVLHNDLGVPLTIGSDVSIGHMAMLHGCTIGDNTLIGINAIILNHAVIGRNCIIGANTLIPERKVIPDGSLVVGTPGRIIRTLTDEEIQAIQDNAAHYVANAKRYQTSLTPVRPSIAGKTPMLKTI